MSEITFYDRSTGRHRLFKLTPRRKQILWHIAYDCQVRYFPMPNFAGRMPRERVPTFFLGYVNIHQIVVLLKRCKLVNFNFPSPHPQLHITPLGMQVLLNTID